jgi:hypothetical protein
MAYGVIWENVTDSKTYIAIVKQNIIMLIAGFRNAYLCGKLFKKINIFPLLANVYSHYHNSLLTQAF